ncbi:MULTISPECIES: hypothetical protein [Pseudofrankia]|uniref:hypothetical protein n=1 Tax=Pseudofrankia TaxID=2994363 RepID=UPI000234C42E|nr:MULTISPECIES: hypothetical protein [Pseudofrankia]
MAKRNVALSLLVVELGAIALLVASLISFDWHQLWFALSVSIAIPCWLLAVKAPSTCGVTTQRGTPCRNRTVGVLFGCSQAPGGGHVWAKFFARFGWHPHQPVPADAENSASPSTRGSTSPDGTVLTAHQRGIVVVRLEEDMQSTLTFWMTVVATLSGVISTAAIFA